MQGCLQGGLQSRILRIHTRHCAQNGIWRSRVLHSLRTQVSEFSLVKCYTIKAVVILCNNIARFELTHMKLTVLMRVVAWDAVRTDQAISGWQMRQNIQCRCSPAKHPCKSSVAVLGNTFCHLAHVYARGSRVLTGLASTSEEHGVALHPNLPSLHPAWLRQ